MWGWRGKAGRWVVMILSQQCSQKLLIMCYVLLPQSLPCAVLSYNSYLCSRNAANMGGNPEGLGCAQIT